MQSGELIFRERAAFTGTPLGESDLERAWDCLAQVMDPEVPVVSVVDLGMIRAVAGREGHLHVQVSPTYSGCPATEVIERDVRDALEHFGFHSPRIERVLAPAWTTDWITDQGHAALKAYGIAPPPKGQGRDTLRDPGPAACPHCGGTDTEQLSEFGSTACKALYRCRDCLEPFDYFKCL